MAGERAKDGVPYWAVVQGTHEHPILGGSHYGVRVDPGTDEWQWGRVFSTEAAAQLEYQAAQDRQAAAWSDPDTAEPGLLTVEDYLTRYRVQRVMHLAGAPVDHWESAA